MPSDSLPDAQPRRLHPSSLLFALGAAAKNFVVPILLLVVFSRGERYQFWYVAGLIPVAIAFLVRYISYRYRFGSDELIIREGILTRNERHIPYSRIQNIDLTRNPAASRAERRRSADRNREWRQTRGRDPCAFGGRDRGDAAAGVSRRGNS